jgi:hypothetical protein
MGKIKGNIVRWDRALGRDEAAGLRALLRMVLKHTYALRPRSAPGACSGPRLGLPYGMHWKIMTHMVALGRAWVFCEMTEAFHPATSMRGPQSTIERAAVRVSPLGTAARRASSLTDVM